MSRYYTGVHLGTAYPAAAVRRDGRAQSIRERLRVEVDDPAASPS
jgi:hypothetical protein